MERKRKAMLAATRLLPSILAITRETYTSTETYSFSRLEIIFYIYIANHNVYSMNGCVQSRERPIDQQRDRV
jgi:hypothetical protein